jgi:hypothetical protein
MKIMAIVYLTSKEVGEPHEPPPKAVLYNLWRSAGCHRTRPSGRSGVQQTISKAARRWHRSIPPQTAKRWPDYCHKARNASPIIATSRETKSDAAKYA